MGLCAEKTAVDFKLTRELMDAYSISSYERTIAAMNAGKFVDEIVPIKLSEKETVTIQKYFITTNLFLLMIKLIKYQHFYKILPPAL